MPESRWFGRKVGVWFRTGAESHGIVAIVAGFADDSQGGAVAQEGTVTSLRNMMPAQANESHRAEVVHKDKSHEELRCCYVLILTVQYISYP